ncbi:MAG: phosphoribosyltransferase family protein [Vicinamibacterales bacterium]
MRFADRQRAAHLLAEKLQRYRDSHPLVLAVPRGGVPMARIVAAGLGCDFDVVLVRKLRTPGQPELAMGAVDEAGHVYQFGVREADGRDLRDEVAVQLAEIRRRRLAYSSATPRLSAAGRTAIIVDDGLATGATMVAAIRSVRAERPLRIVVAVPVASGSALDLARSYADDVVCLYTPRLFFAVGDFYDDFSQVSDEEVVEVLSERPGVGAEGG